MLDKEQEALDILYNLSAGNLGYWYSGAKIVKIKDGVIFMTLKPTEDNHEVQSNDRLCMLCKG